MPIPPVPFVPADMHGKLAFVAMLAYSGAPEGADAVIAPFRALGKPVADLVAAVPYTTLYMLDPPPEAKSAVSIRSRYATQFGLDEAKAMLAAIESCDAPMKMAQIRVLGGAFSRVPSDATAFGHRDETLLIAFLAMYGGPPEVTAKYEAWAAKAIGAIASPDRPAYMNFLAAEGDAGLRSAYPVATLARLRRVKRTYDPENLFRFNQNIVP